jgi:Fuc2NAc and GlcNAc transferase
MVLFLLLVVLSFFASVGAVSWVCRSAEKLRLVEVPNHRSSHTRPTPTGGGLGIVISSSTVGAFICVHFEWMQGMYALGLAAGLAVAGLTDDVRGLSARVRLMIQLVLSVLLFSWCFDFNDIILSINNVFYDYWIIGYLVSLTAFIWWINLFNFMDGIDGLAGSQAVYMLLGGSLLCVWTGALAVSAPIIVLSACVASATVGFLAFNWSPAKIFMGDAGSTWLAFIIVFIAVSTIQSGVLTVSAWCILSAVFVSDATITLVRRVVSGQRWSEAHRSHAYQRLARFWAEERCIAHRRVTLLAMTVNWFWLFPLAALAVFVPAYGLFCVGAAYLPIVIGVLSAGAGLSDGR